MAAEYSRPTVTNGMRSSSSGARSGNARPGIHCGSRPARGGIRRVTALCAVRACPGRGRCWPRGTALTERTGREDRHMPGPGELPALQPGLIVGRDAALARLRALVDPAPPPSRVLLVTGEAGQGRTG